MESDRYVIGVDIGGTSIKGALFDGDAIIEESRFPTKPDPLDALKRVISSLLANPKKATLIGIASAGDVEKDGRMIRCYNIPQIENRNLKTYVEDIFGIPSFVLNDAKAALIAELFASKIEGNTALLTFGTGIGCAVRVNGEIHQGGEYNFGHMILEPGGPVCGCGRKGCAESLASATALLRQANEVYGYEMPFPKLVQLLSKGDEKAQAIFEQFGKRLITIIDTIVSSIDGIVILGGGMMEAHKRFERYYDSRKQFYRYAILGNRAGVYGAMEYAKEMRRK